MKVLATILLSIIASYSFGQTQAEMNQVAYGEFEKADKELNQTYKKILTKYKSDTAFITNLKASQRIWITFRDAELKMKYPDREAGYYGSVHPLCRAAYLEQLTRERIKKLQEWLNLPPEDGCSSSVETEE